MKQVHGADSQRKWEFLRKRSNLETENLEKANNEGSEDDDPFDCSELAVPSTKVLVDQVLEEFVQQWKDLDQRKIPAQSLSKKRKNRRSSDSATDSGGEEEGEDDASARDAATHRLPNWGWHANRLRLPNYFDYATRRSSPPSPRQNEDMVVSLSNPLLHVSYEQELWKLFQSVPTISELEEDVLEGAACQNSRQLQDEMTRALTENSRYDGHGVARMRHRDRHGLPAPIETEPPAPATTVRIECWRRQLKRGSSPDCDRMELEFLGSQTLLNVHKAIIELSQDELWKNETSDETREESGLFFIDETFYTAGPVDYTTPITEWLDQPPSNKTNSNRLSRRCFLGIPEDATLLVRPMSEARLDELSFTLGLRYYHVCRGDAECSIFITDSALTPKRPNTIYPIVHDIWSPSNTTVECEACKRLAVAHVVAPPGDEMTHGGPTAMCLRCSNQFYESFPAKRSSVISHQLYREQTDLSVGHDANKAPF